MNLNLILRKYADMVRWSMDHWLNGLPSVTILCPTFGRPHLLNEAVESFIRQDYSGELKMLILNDQPELKIFSEIKNLTVINKDKRYTTLAEKRKSLIGMGDTDLCMIFGDDDLLMPWAVSSAVSGMVSHILFVVLGHVRYNCKRNVAAYFPKAPLPGPALFNRKFVKKIPIVQNHNPPGFELQFVSSIHRHVPKELKPLTYGQSKQLPWDKVYYMARTNLPNHMSVGKMGYDKCGEFVSSLNLSGEVEIVPKWDRDYEGIFKEAVSKRIKKHAS